MAYVVGVAGVPGAGKSTLVAALARALPGAAALHMDGYENMTRLPIAEVARWFREGADIDAFQFPALEAELARRKAAPGGPLLFETQFGRAHRATGRHVDFLIWLDAPLDLALARALHAALARGAPQAWLQGYLDNYLGTVRDLLEMQKARVAPQADLVLDARGTPAEIAARARAAIPQPVP
jgi:uridine kinase